jgi:spore germination protein YaaH
MPRLLRVAGRLAVAVTASAALGGAATPAGGAGRAGRAGRAMLPSRFVSVWLPYWNLPAASASALAHADQIAVASPFWWTVAPSGRITTEAADPDLVAELRARGVAIVPTVTESAGLRAFKGLLADPARRAALVSELTALASAGPYSGIDLDFEQFAVDRSGARLTRDVAAVALAYPRFVSQLCHALHRIGRTCTVTVMARWSAAQTRWRRSLATSVYDYAALGAVADRIRIMAYDQHAPGGAPGPVASLPWVQQVISYARARIPPAKVELGLAGYGYLWGRGAVRSFPAAQAPSVAAAEHARVRWSPAAAEETFSGDRHVGWFEDARADTIRAQLAAAAGFAGVALWAAGDETQALWSDLAALRFKDSTTSGSR